MDCGRGDRGRGAEVGGRRRGSGCAWFKQLAATGTSWDGEMDKLRKEMKDANAEMVRNTPALW